MSLKIALAGYGQMGKAVETEAIKRGHIISAKIDLGQSDRIKALSPVNTDVIIEFTQPDQAVSNFRQLIPLGIPVVTGTTGWWGQLEEVKQLAAKNNAAFLYSANFSVGVNLLFSLNKKLAQLMNRYPEYDCFIEEAHHKHKKDAPGGTALALAKQTIQELDRKTSWAGAALTNRAPKPEELSIAHTRAGAIYGRHSVVYTSEIDEIQLRHEAFNRRGFALGAVLAAEWLVGKQGFFNFTEIFEQI